MRVCIYLAYAFYTSFSLAELLTTTSRSSDSMITPAPDVPLQLLRKQNDNRFMGWVSLGGTWVSRTCNPGYTYFQAGSQWRCCHTSLAGCNVPVGCVGGSLIFRVSTSGTQTSTLSTVPCTSGATDAVDQSLSVCNTGLLYESTEAAGTDARTNIFCGPSSLIFSYYRIRPADSTSTSSSSTPQSTPASTTGQESQNPSTTTVTSSPPPPSQPVNGNASQAWIAGAVVGPVIGLALIGAILFFLLRRNKNKNKDENSPPAGNSQMQHPSQTSYPGSPHPTANNPSMYIENQQKPDTLPELQAPYTVVPFQQQQQQQYQQQWQQYPQQGQQMYTPQPGPGSPGSLPQQQQQQGVYADQVYGGPNGVGERPFSAELDAGGYQGGGRTATPREAGQNR